LAALPYYELHRYNIERTRAETIRRAAAAADRLERPAREPHPDPSAVLRSVPGIGPWTAAWASLAALGDPDAVPVGDYGIPGLVAWTLEGEPEADDARMLELLEPFTGHRGRVILLLKGSGSKPPRRGPRMSQAELSGY
jgi:3-methyladenine DNA glycosylase/8-oxoguanine DNA glycosylase